MAEPLFVRLAHDPEADVWYIEETNIIGLAGEASTFETLLARLPSLIADMVEENYSDSSLFGGPVQVLASTSIRIAEAA